MLTLKLSCLFQTRVAPEVPSSLPVMETSDIRIPLTPHTPGTPSLPSKICPSLTRPGSPPIVPSSSLRSLHRHTGAELLHLPASR